MGATNIQETKSFPVKGPDSTLTSHTQLRRACACGNHASSGACAECSKKNLALQRKTRKPPETRNHDSVPPIVHEALSSPGQPLDPASRSFMEPHFGHDFSQVRVQTDARAAVAAHAVQARAFTFGQNIVFAAGQYRPESTMGRKLIAHELTHVVQQRGISSNYPPPLVSDPGDPAEAEADRAATAALSEQLPIIHSRSRSVVARQDNAGPKKPNEGEMRQIPGPSPKGPNDPEEEKFEEAASQPRGREKSSAPATWGWGAPETNNVYQECRVAPMSRERFLKFEATLPKGPPKPQRKKPTDGPHLPLGATWADLSAGVAPEIAVEPVKEDGDTLFRLKPTHAEMPPIKSGHTQAGPPFQEGKQTFMAYDAGGQRVCPELGGIAPLFWQVTEGGAKKIWAGEMEHCSDYRAAFNVTLALFASMINNEAAAERRYRTEKQALDETKKRLKGIPLEPVDMLNECGREMIKSQLRDDWQWHGGVPSESRKPQENNCKGYLGVFSEKSFPEVGDGPGKEKHSSQEVLQGTVGKIKGKP